MTPWLATSTFYGNWLPGDPRGSVTSVRDRRPGDPSSTLRREHDRVGTAYDTELPGLHRAALESLKGSPIRLDLPKAEQLLDQFIETANYRNWTLRAASIMHDHIHWVVEVPSRYGKNKILQDFKAYGSRRLTAHFGRPDSDTWWTHDGSCRAVRDLGAALFYVLHRQPRPLLIWSRVRGRIDPAESHPDNAYPGEAWDDSIPFAPDRAIRRQP